MGKMWVAFSLWILASSVWGGTTNPVDKAPSLPHCGADERDFSYVWWANGWDEKGPVRPLHLCLRTGHYGMVLDAERLSFPHLGVLKESAPVQDVLGEGDEVVSALPEGDLSLMINVDGKTYACLAGAIGWQDRARWVTFPVRIVESGRFLQHFQVHGLVFEEPEGGQLPADSWLDVKALPHRFELSLHVIPEREWVDGEMRLEMESQGSIQYQGKSKDKWTGPWEVGEERSLTLHVSFAMEDDLEETNNVRVDYRSSLEEDWIELQEVSERRLLHQIDLPETSWSLEEEPDHMERLHVRVRNQATDPLIVPLLFAKEYPFPGITGMCPMILDPDGRPTGIPVQLSKNWHRQKDLRLLEEGPWFRGVTLLHLPPESELLFQFAITYVQWGGIPSASHAQLCLIGWGSNQVWDQSAIGSWGESICYEPNACQRRCMIDDLRPLMVTSMDAKKPQWTWTNNVGGGDFLLLFDRDSSYVPHKGVRTFYRCQGPNLTDVRYAGTIANEAIDFKLHACLPRSEDHVRVFHTLRYDIREEIRPSRLAFYQLGADRYNEGLSRVVTVGNVKGVIQSIETQAGEDGYQRQGLPWQGDSPWVSLHDSQAPEKTVGAWANRGLILRRWRARLGGQDQAMPFLSVYRSNAQEKPNPIVELSLPQEGMTLLPGDFFEAEIELVVLPISPQDYYGPNASFKKALEEMKEPCQLVQREAVGNALEVEMKTATLLKSYPLEVNTKLGREALLKVRGGLGYVPVTFTGCSSPFGHQLHVQREGDWTLLDQSVHGNDFWQVIHNPSEGTWDVTFNLRLGGTSKEVTLALNQRMP